MSASDLNELGVGWTPVNILVIEGDEAMSLLLDMNLRRLHYKVLLTRSAEDGLAIVQSEHLAGIFLDDRLPQASVEMCCAEVKHSLLNSQTPVILTTTAVAANALVYAQRLGADRVLRKPFRPRDIQMVLEGVLY